jgi:hypothetical protein
MKKQQAGTQAARKRAKVSQHGFSQQIDAAACSMTQAHHHWRLTCGLHHSQTCRHDTEADNNRGNCYE